MDDKPPEFTVDEINRLRQMCYGSLNPLDRDYRERCLKLVEDHEAKLLVVYHPRVVAWLWGIKSGLKGG